MALQGTKALEAWCRDVTSSYAPKVRILNMSTSWRNGMGFCAIIHHFRPELIPQFDTLDPDDVAGNNHLAFTVAEQHLGVPSLLDPQDMVECELIDRLSILTYLSQFYQAFHDKSPHNPGCEKIFSPAPATTVSPRKGSSGGNGLPIMGKRNEPCKVCGNLVFILERLYVDGKLLHRTCFKCARCSAQLSLANYYETESGDYCCDVCPDVEAAATKAASAASAINKSIEDGATSEEEEDEEDTSEDESDHEQAVERSMSPADGIAETDSISRNSASVAENNLSSQLTELTVADSQADTKGENGCEATNDNMDSEIKSNESSNVDQVVSETKVELHTNSSEHANNIVSEDSVSTEGQMNFCSTTNVESSQSSSNSHSPVQISVTEPSETVNTGDKLDNVETIVTKSDQVCQPHESVSNGINSDLSESVISDEACSTSQEHPKPSIIVPESQSLSGNNESESAENIELNKEGESNVEESEEPSRPSVDQSADSFDPCESVPSPLVPSDDKEPSVEDIPSLDRKSSYPVNKNPFDSDSGDEEVESEGRTEKAPPVVQSTNPFGSDFEEEEEEEEVAKPLPSPQPRKAAGGPAKPPRAAPTSAPVVTSSSLNPFGSDFEDDDEDQDQKSLLNRSTAASSTSSPALSTSASRLRKKKRPAPPPPPQTAPASTTSSLLTTPTSSSARLAATSGSSPVPAPRKSRSPVPAVRQSLAATSGAASSSTASTSSSLSLSARQHRPPPRPPPPPTTTPGGSSGGKSAKDLENLNRRSQILTSGVPPLAAFDDDTSSVYSSASHATPGGGSINQDQFKRKKGPAPPRPIPPKRSVLKLPRETVNQELRDNEIKQSELERQGVKLEKTIRELTKQQQEGENIDNDESATAVPAVTEGVENGGQENGVAGGNPSSDADHSKAGVRESLGPEAEDLIIQLFELVNLKNDLIRRQTVLMYMKREHRLEEEQVEIEHQVRGLMAKPEALRTPDDRTTEERLIERLMAIVDERNEIVNCIEMDRVRALEEDESIETHMEEYAAVPRPAGAEDEAKVKKKKKKKEKKKKKKNKGYDADKDIDTKEFPGGASAISTASSSPPSRHSKLSPVKKRLTAMAVVSPLLMQTTTGMLTTDKEKAKKLKKKIMSSLKPSSKKKDANA